MARFIRGTALALGAGAMLVTPAYAEDAAKTGLLAGLGVAAATGKTSLEEGAGAIEAGLLNADSLRQAAAIIAGLVADKNKEQRPLVVLGKTGTVDLISYELVIDRLDAASKTLETADSKECPAEPKPKTKTSIKTYSTEETLGGLGGPGKSSALAPALADLGILLTDTSIGPIGIEASEQRMVNAMLMQGGAERIPATAGAWQPYAAERAGTGSRAISMRVTDEPVAWTPSGQSKVKTAYSDLVRALRDYKNKCKDESRAELGKAATALAEKVADASGGPSILARAMQAESIAKGRPLLLRVVTEQIGGTAISRSGVLYTFGWPNAATVSAGVLVGFRLIDPETGGVTAVGEVRCLTSQINIKHVRDVLLHDSGKGGRTAEAVLCDYRAV